MFLSGETCTGDFRVVVAPGSKACLKAWNEPRKRTWAVQESAAVVVLRVAHQRSQEGPNDEEGGAINRLGAREHLFT